MTATAEAADGHIHGYGSRPYRSYVLTTLLAAYILNFIDRALLGVVAPKLKPELGISDTAFGLLTGFGFALLYTVVGIPVAQIAETRHRVWIMAICITLWSVMTALCGLAAPVTIGSITIGAFWILLACRVGVGIGESGCTPPANSLIADYYPPARRSTALGFYAMGVTLGTVLANLIGGPVTDAFGWRAAFFVVGLPGVLLAVLMVMTVREPPRGYTDPPGAVRRARATFGDALKELSAKPTFWLVTAGSMLAAFGGYGINSFQSLFLNRSFGLTAGEAGVWVNTPVGLVAALGTFGAGWAVERLGRRHPTAIGWLPGICIVLSTPVHIVAFSTGNLPLCVAALCIGGALKYTYLTGQYTIGQGVASAQSRAVAIAIILFVVNLLGYGLGPLFTGLLSDVIFNAQVADLGAPELVRKSCEGAARAALAASQQEVCKIAHPESLRLSMLATSCVYMFSGFFFLLSCRWLKRDMVAV